MKIEPNNIIVTNEHVISILGIQLQWTLMIIINIPSWWYSGNSQYINYCEYLNVQYCYDSLNTLHYIVWIFLLKFGNCSTHGDNDDTIEWMSNNKTKSSELNWTFTVININMKTCVSCNLLTLISYFTFWNLSCSLSSTFSSFVFTNLLNEP